MNYVDLFSGAGGLGLGFEKAGFKNLFAVEYDESAANTYKLNFPKNKLIVSDIRDITDTQLKEYSNNEDVDVIIGGPPCQGFSMAGEIGRKFIDDERNYLFKEFVRVVKILNPKIFVMENVARMETHNKGKTIKQICEEFEKIGYKIQFKVLNAVDYKVPQNRRRIFVVGTLPFLNFKFPSPDKNIYSVKEAIDDLPPLKSGESSQIPNHIAMNHSQQMLKKMSYVKDGGDRTNIPEEIRPKSGDSRKYIRYNSTLPSITITGDMRKVFHYSQNRALTPRELARIQTFPDNFIFVGTSTSIQQQIGNAVPPNLSFYIAESIKNTLNNYKYINNIESNNNPIQLELFPTKIFDNNYPNINYIGNKNKLVSWIADIIPSDVSTIIDGFAGGGSVSYEFKKLGYQVISNDILYSSFVINKAFIENSKEILTVQELEDSLDEIPTSEISNKVKALENVLYFDYEIEELSKLVSYSNKLTGYKKYIYLSLLRRAMIRKLPYSRMNINWNNIQKLRDEEYSYKKYKRRRAYHNQSFYHHMLEDLNNYNAAIFNNGQKNQVYQKDILDLLERINQVDLIYLDPPYPETMNNYDAFYDKFDILFQKKEKHINLTTKDDFSNYMTEIIKKSSSISKYLLLSINKKSKNSFFNILKTCENYGSVEVISKKHNYQISGKQNKNSNTELLILVTFK